MHTKRRFLLKNTRVFLHVLGRLAGAGSVGGGKGGRDHEPSTEEIKRVRPRVDGFGDPLWLFWPAFWEHFRGWKDILNQVSPKTEKWTRSGPVPRRFF